jgi:hypothetical protein
MLELFTNLDYVQFGIKNFKFVEERGKQEEPGDYLFIPETKRNAFLNKP